MGKKTVSPPYEPPCRECGGSCCKYVAIEIDTPTCKSDYDKIRWYLAHRDINIFVDHEKTWHIEFRTPCEEQDTNNRCLLYEERPNVCRDYGTEEGLCEYYDSPFILYFEKRQEFEAWLESKGKEWRFRKWAGKQADGK